MLLALGAVSAALDAIQSLTTPKQSSSKGAGFAPASTSPSDSPSAIGVGTPPVSGFSNGPQISPDNISALLTAQSQSTGFNGSHANSLLSAPPRFSNAATSAYNAIDQLAQEKGAAIPHSPALLSLTV